MPKLSEEQQRKYDAITSKIVAIREKGYLPRGYAKTIAQKLDVSENKVYQVTSGNSIHSDIVDAVLEMAAQSKIDQQIKKADDILAD